MAALAPTPPLVTAIMPTRDRPEFALQAVRYFLDQDYPNKEMVVIEDGTATLAGRMPDDPRIRYHATGKPLRTIGAMRNEACELAGGEIIAHWDDDDWYGPQRLTRQVEAIRSDDADLTGLRDSLMLDLATWRFWRCTPDLHRRIFYIGDIHGATMTYRRGLWEEARFPDQSLAEDAIFLDQALRAGARLESIDAEGLFIYIRHGANAWEMECGQYAGTDGWETVPEPDMTTDARAFYSARSAASTQP